MYIDYKITNWQRVHIPDDANKTQEEIIEMVKNAQQGNNWLWDEIEPEPSFEDLMCEEFIHPIDNNNQSTIEIYNEDGGLLWDNSIKQENHEIN